MSTQWWFWRIQPIAIVVTLVACVASTAVGAQEPPRIGLKIHTLTAELRKQHGLPGALGGALVIAVEPGSPAAEKGIAAGEVVVNANGKSVSTAKAVAAQIQASRASGRIVLTLVGVGGGRKEVTIPVPNRADEPGVLLPGPK